MKLYEQIPLSTDNPRFRLLELDISSDVYDVVRAKVDIYNLRDGVDYEALSYAWGPKDSPAQVELNGELFSVS
jgi:hypothetical protein